MAAIRVPTGVATSPEGGDALKFYPADRTFRDERGNEWTVDELARARPGNKIKKWVRDNYPESTGSSDE